MTQEDTIKYKGCTIIVARYEETRRPYCCTVVISEGRLGFSTIVGAKRFVRQIVRAREIAGVQKVNRRQYVAGRNSIAGAL